MGVNGHCQFGNKFGFAHGADFTRTGLVLSTLENDFPAE
jgi:hypothetical protein